VRGRDGALAEGERLEAARLVTMSTETKHPVLQALASQLRDFANAMETAANPTPELELAVASLIALPLSPRPDQYGLDDIVYAVCAAMAMPLSQVMSKSKTQRVANVRQLAMYFCRELRPDASFPRIGEVFNRDHSTVIHAFRLISRRPVDSMVRKAVADQLAAVVAARMAAQQEAA
jgi:chromosomal replication initiation ATPase DnaA